jgi:Domain of unknown function (DUF4266)
MKIVAIFSLASTLLTLSSGCANVKPWQRGQLADYTMTGEGHPLGAGTQEHIWFSREEASGGGSVGGGGCGCN